ncbi:hypothetical protein A2585_03185 [Candidatus Nomurabacteria bacterium RIFOXYD1_FULL_39_12]|nr:MAG: hypothetical protein A2585_03185 [Candidatus Nomurabacteria bacterium RIFOXYD1_FULL_39_12]
MNKVADVDIGNVFLGSSNANLSNLSGIGLYVSAIITGSISIAGIIFLFLLVGSGIAMISGAGKNDPQSVQKGKQTATSALIGFVVVFMAYWIVKLIELITGLNLISI